MWKYLSGCSQPRWSQINMSFLISLILINAWHMHSFAKNVISQAEASRAPAVPLPVIRDPPLLRVKRCLLTLASVSCGSQHSSLLTLYSKDRFKIHLTAVTSPLPLSCPPLSCSWTLYTEMTAGRDRVWLASVMYHLSTTYKAQVHLIYLVNV